MASYFDTSVLVPLFFNETGTSVARAEVVGASSVWVSHWTLAEFSSATAFKLRTGQADLKTVVMARQLFGEFVASSLTVVDVLREDFVAAAHLCESTPMPGLRTPDALHFAVARRLGLPLITFDTALAGACRLHGSAHRVLS